MLVVVALEQIAVREHIPRVIQKASLPARIPDSGHADRSGAMWDIRVAYVGNVSGEAGMHAGHASLLAR